MTDILIREAKEFDLLTIEKLTLELIEAMGNTEGIDIKLIAKNCRNLLSEVNSHILVAEVKGVVAGFVNFTTRKTILHHSLSGLIDELIVAKSYRGKGIGKQLLSSAIKKSRQLGCCEVEVSTEKTNIKAREFYRQCGFADRGVLFEIDL
ncbi:GNAT family N-acetyltransferase [Candidatus Atribacteria bacterium 1244-E10-H5-B2]|nr:MAG: GNAT family N-acetyltransferase [Candidatus Atribacteria bacterium 1244-E10-H5-B2]